MGIEVTLIPFNRASIGEPELTYLQQAVMNGHVSGGGPFTRRAESLLSQFVGNQRILLTTSCTHALEMSARLLDLQPGDEVLVPSFTFVSTASAFLHNGSRPVFVDIDPLTLNVSLEQAEAAITSRTRAICIVHYAGVGAQPDDFRRLADARGLSLIEDNAHGLGGSWRGKPLGTFGSMSTMSFHETKNITCGEGGALALETQELVERGEILREKGTDRARFFRGQVDKYTWVDNGSSWVMSDLLAAVLTAQLERFGQIQQRRRAIWDTYDHELASWAADSGVRTPYIPDEAVHPAHMYYLLMPTLDARTAFIKHLRALGVMSVFHYVPLEETPFGLSLTSPTQQPCPVSMQVSDSLVRLPLFPSMSHADIERVLEAVTSFKA